MVGAKEAESEMVNVRKGTEDGKDILLSLPQAINAFKDLAQSKSRNNYLNQV